MTDGVEHTLAFLLAFDGRVHHYADGYFVKFENEGASAWFALLFHATRSER